MSVGAMIALGAAGCEPYASMFGFEPKHGYAPPRYYAWAGEAADDCLYVPHDNPPEEYRSFGWLCVGAIAFVAVLMGAILAAQS